jgi:hypothetical protein
MAPNHVLVIVALILLGYAVIVALPMGHSNIIYDAVRIAMGVLIFIGFAVLMLMEPL